MSESKKKGYLTYRFDCGCVIQHRGPDISAISEYVIIRKCEKHSAMPKAELLRRMVNTVKYLKGKKPKAEYREVNIKWASPSSKLSVGPDGRFYQVHTLGTRTGRGYKGVHCRDFCPAPTPLSRYHWTCIKGCRVRLCLEGKIPVIDPVIPFLLLARVNRPFWKKKLEKLFLTIYEWIIT